MTLSSWGYVPVTTSVQVVVQTYAQDERSQLPLVIYNTNDADALDIAVYYQEAREINADRLCGVALPRGHFAVPNDLIKARDHVVENCFCPLVQENGQACSLADFPALLDFLPVTHLVLIRGLPGRLMNTGWNSDNENPAFDYFFSDFS